MKTRIKRVLAFVGAFVVLSFSLFSAASLCASADTAGDDTDEVTYTSYIPFQYMTYSYRGISSVQRSYFTTGNPFVSTTGEVQAIRFIDSLEGNSLEITSSLIVNPSSRFSEVNWYVDNGNTSFVIELQAPSMLLPYSECFQFLTSLFFGLDTTSNYSFNYSVQTECYFDYIHTDIRNLDVPGSTVDYSIGSASIQRHVGRSQTVTLNASENSTLSPVIPSNVQYDLDAARMMLSFVSDDPNEVIGHSYWTGSPNNLYLTNITVRLQVTIPDLSQLEPDTSALRIRLQSLVQPSSSGRYTAFSSYNYNGITAHTDTALSSNLNDAIAPLVSASSSFFEAPFFGSWTFGMFGLVAIGLALLMYFLKVFAGG